MEPQIETRSTRILRELGKCDAPEIFELRDIRTRAEPLIAVDVRTFINCVGFERALEANVRAWHDYALRGRVLTDVGSCDLSTTVLSERVALPVLIGPFNANFVHQEAELGVARASASAGTMMTLGMGATCPPEDVGMAAGRFWIHVEETVDRGLIVELVERAVAAGATAVCFTVSRPVPPLWSREMLDAVSRLPWDPFLAREGRTDLGLGWTLRRRFGWDDLAWLCGVSPVPVAVKGIQTAEDARLACDHGASAVVVSNHGGFMLEEALGTADMLPEVVAEVGERAEVLVDGGIRSGVDVLRALSLGARAVLIGRLALWGLAVDGENGCKRVLHLLSEELEVQMAMTGARSISEIDRTAIVRTRQWRETALGRN